MVATKPRTDPPLCTRPFDDAASAVNAWRGHCLASLARAEQAVTECLADVMHFVGKDRRPKQLHLIGQKYGFLARVLEENRWHGRHNVKALSAVQKMEPYHELRILLCHATAQITIDREGRWTSVWRLANLADSTLLRQIEVVTQDDAALLAAELKRASDRLGSLLGNVRAELTKAA